MRDQDAKLNAFRAVMRNIVDPRARALIFEYTNDLLAKGNELGVELLGVRRELRDANEEMIRLLSAQLEAIRLLVEAGRPAEQRIGAALDVLRRPPPPPIRPN